MAAEPIGGKALQEARMSTTIQRTTSSIAPHQASGPIYIAGGTGKTGRRVARQLEALGVPVRIGSRSSEIPFDWERPGGWHAALRGCRTVYAAYAPDVAAPGALSAIEQVVETAKQTGIERIVFLSGRGESEAQEAEAVVQNSGLHWTIVRCSWFMQNFSESYFADGLLAGQLALPIGDIGEPFVDADDIAEVAATALTQPGHMGQLYELTGPRTLTFAEAVAEIAAATGRPIQYTRIEQGTFDAELRAMSVPEEVIWLLRYLFTTVLDGRNAWQADGVKSAQGRPQRDYRDYARAAAASGALDPSA
jgi:uncharacterized protein YbjT (DUF2867 family)